MAGIRHNFNEVAQRLNAMSENVQQKVKEAVEFYAGEIEMEAIRNAPGPGDNIATQRGTQNLRDIKPDKGWAPVSQAIGYQIDSTGYKATVFVERSAGEVAAWIEFGTGQSARSYLASVPPEWKALAAKFYINGRGTILAQPYFLPAFLRNQILFVNELKDILRSARI